MLWGEPGRGLLGGLRLRGGLALGATRGLRLEPGRGLLGVGGCAGCSRSAWVLRCGVNRAEGRWPTRAFAWGLLAGGYSGLGVARGVSPGAGLVGVGGWGKAFCLARGMVTVGDLEVVRSALGLRLNPGLWGEPGRGLLGVGGCAGFSRSDWVLRCGVSRAEGRWPRRAVARGLAPGVPVYDSWMAATGSMRIARSAGSEEAAPATTTSRSVTSRKVSGSVELTP